jgi:hypothetical protein
VGRPHDSIREAPVDRFRGQPLEIAVSLFEPGNLSERHLLRSSFPNLIREERDSPAPPDLSLLDSFPP